MFAAILAGLMYYFVILPQKKQEDQNSKSIPNDPITVLPLLVTFGVILPFILVEPFWIIEYLNINSSASKLTIMTLPINTSLRFLEAYFGCTPHAAKKSLSQFLMYISCLASSTSIDKPNCELIPVTKAFVYQRLKEFSRTYLIMSGLFSVLAPVNFYPFEESRNLALGSMDYKIMDMFSPYHLLGNFLLALTLSVSLDQSTTGLSVIYNVLYGVQTGKVVLNPMLKSESPSHFWGRRWNMTVHTGLKGGIYKPMRTNGYSKVVAVLVTFLGSGLLHEYVIYILLQGHESTIPSIRYGKNIIFFGWNGILVMTESILSSNSSFQKSWWMGRIRLLPPAFVTALVILSALPVAHLFIDDWIQVGYFSHVQVGMPLLVRL
mmetsp:Transcript_20238/g.29701  ORF Transcript_20238/g.29701 Transcript_20238/m.29701 type:complete len:378 (-) Transcript_20238:50-1183(-)